jgi:predicted TIM-barrel fold metal-dependent hydrolase
MYGPIIDFHTHAFPDSLAERAVPLLEEEAGVKAHLDGKISSLLSSMDEAGIGVSVVASIATRPAQFDSILSWSRSFRSERLIPFASVHPADSQARRRIGEIREAGLAGLKMHPYYQEFVFDEPRMYPLYESMRENGLILLAHTGFDIAFERKPIVNPEKIRRVVEAFPELKLVTSHLGAWEDWDEVERYLLGEPVYMDISYSFHLLGRQRARRLIQSHPHQYILFGSDSPWGDQKQTLDALLRLDLGKDHTQAILHGNAARLLSESG